MRDINVVVLVGRLTKDSELKYTKSGMPVSRFSLAVNRSKKQGEEWVDEVSFFDVDFWGKGAEAVNRYLIKGQQVGVEGELRQDRWEQDGATRSKVVINATNVRLLGGSQGQAAQGQGSTQGASQGNGHDEAAPDAAKPRQYAPASGPQIQASDQFDDDIPF